MICGLFSDSMAALFLFIVAIMAAAFGSILYSYLYYRKKLRTGKGLAVHYNHKMVAQTVDKTLLVSTPEAFFLFSVQKVCT